MTKKEEGAPDAQEFSGAPPAPKVVTPLDIQQKEFRVSRFGGYKMRDVDEFLDEVTEAMSHLLEENQRLHARGGQPAPPPALGAPNLSEASRQADEILGRARVRAARIEQEARDRSASQPTSGEPASVTEADRATVMAFLNREREFLQSMGSLMQQHAEVVKGMARAAKRPKSPGSKPAPEMADTAEGTGGAPPAESDRATERAKTTPEGSTVAAQPRRGAEEKPGTADAPGPGASATSSARQRPGGRSAERSVVRVQEAEHEEEPVRVEEPTPAAVKSDDERVEPPREGSLRELFWGED
jgi:DivIVA domain-containing protein